MEQQRQRPDFERYQYGALAAYLGASKDSARYAPSALEVLVGEKGLNLDSDKISGLLEGTRASKEGLETAIRIYGGKFEEKRAQYTLSGLAAGWYKPVLDGADEGDRDKILAKMATYNETISAIQKAVKKAGLVVQASEDEDLKEEYTAEQIVAAKETLRKYTPAVQIMETLDRYTFESLRPDVVNTARKKDLKTLASNI